MATEEYNEAEMEIDQYLADWEYDSGSESETASLASSVGEILERNGRKYHTLFGQDKNPLPTDETEYERLDITHELLNLITKGRLYHAPVGREQIVMEVLDLGSGSGTWAIDFALDNPDANVFGVDLSPVVPRWGRRIPENCSFEVDDFELEWKYDKKFDFINARGITQSVSDWPSLFSKMYQNINPGGWVELGEWNFTHRSSDSSIPSDWPPAQCYALLRRALSIMGRINPTPEWLRSSLTTAGFHNIHVKTYKLPAGPWAKKPRLKEAGKLFMLGAESGYEAYALSLLTRVLKMPEWEVAEICKRAFEEHLDVRSGVHAYFEFHVAWAQKPKDADCAEEK